jgi:pyruvate formate lyase activating enzyme
MRVGYFQKFSTIDYPKKLSCIIFFKGCNFRCGFCYNKNFVLNELLDTTKDVAIKDILEFLETRKKKLDGVVLTGGEPSIYGDEVIELMKDIKKKGFLIKLDTNGSNPEFIQKIIDLDLVDYLAMDLKQVFNKYYLFTKVDPKKIEETFNIIKNTNIDHEFRITIHPELNLDDFKEIIEKAKGQKIYVQNFINKNTIKNYKNPQTIYSLLSNNSKNYILR